MTTESHYVCDIDRLDWQVAQEFEANFRWEYADGRDHHCRRRGSYCRPAHCRCRWWRHFEWRQ
jgi:hypothetical protein